MYLNISGFEWTNKTSKDVEIMLVNFLVAFIEHPEFKFKIFSKRSSLQPNPNYSTWWIEKVSTIKHTFVEPQ